jgi:hypothetical protein
VRHTGRVEKYEGKKWRKNAQRNSP